MKEILAEIQSGDFAREWIAENRAGQENFKRMRDEQAGHQVEIDRPRAARADGLDRHRVPGVAAGRIFGRRRDWRQRVEYDHREAAAESPRAWACHPATVEEAMTQTVLKIPEELKPVDGRFGSGPSRVRRRAARAPRRPGRRADGNLAPPAAGQAAGRAGSCRTRGAVRRSPTATRWRWATAGQPRSGTRRPVV